MGACSSKDGQSKDDKAMKQLQSADLMPLIDQLKITFSRYRKQQGLRLESNNHMILLQQQIRNIYMGMIKDKITATNQAKITMKQCKIELSQQLLQVQILVLKYIQGLNVKNQKVDMVKKFFELIAQFSVTLARFLKTIYPRGQNMEAGQLAKMFNQFDSTQEFQYDILKNAGFVFTSPDEFDITNTIKLLINKIIDELDAKFPDFNKLIHDIDPSFKVGRKINENTARYVKLDTGTVQIRSTQVARVLIKWMEELTEMINKANQKITAKNEYKFYKTFPEQNRIQFSKCQQATFNKILSGGLLFDLNGNAEQYAKKQKIRKSKFRKFGMNLIQTFNIAQHYQSEVSKQTMQIIKYSYFNNKFIAWRVEEQLIQAIKCLIQVSKEYQEFRGTLDLLKFKINDLMRCQIFGSKAKITEVNKKIQKLCESGQLQLVKVKNRFSTPMSDAMLFFKLPNSFIICQCQLILSEQNKGDDAKKAKNVQTLNHFLYQLQRSPFGMLGQISVFLTAKSESVSAYCDTIKLRLKDTKKIQYCKKNHKQKFEDQKKKYKEQKSPILCSSCINFFPKFSNKIRIHNCYKCGITLCNKCMGQTFEINEDMLKQTLDKKISGSIEQIKKTNFYRHQRQQFDESLALIKSQTLLKQVFEVKKLTQVFKDKTKGNRLKVQVISEYIYSNQNYRNIYIEKGLKVNFVIATWRGASARFICYRYDHDFRRVINVFQPIERYEAHEFIDVNPFDMFLEFTGGEICKANQKNIRKDGYSLRGKSNLQRGFYIFQGQLKQKMSKQFDQIKQATRDQYLLIDFDLGGQLFLIIDIDMSLKRSQKADKMKEQLKVIEKKNFQVRKYVKMTNMGINNSSFDNFNDHLDWVKHVKIMDLSDNNIDDATLVLDICPKLQKLSVNNNRFEQLRFRKPLYNLKEIDASQNRIEKVINLYYIKKIEIINLKSNMIPSLTKNTGNFLNIRLESPFKNMFGSKKVIKKQQLNNEDQFEIDNINEAQLGGKNQYLYLRQINLANNCVEDMEEFNSQCFPNLTYLNLDDNYIQEIQKITIDKLEQIHLNNNWITDLSNFAQSQINTLNQISFKNNRIKVIPKFNFYNLTKADFSYNLSQNMNSFITGPYFQDLTNIHLSKTNIQDIPKLGKKIRVLGLQRCSLDDDHLQKFLAQLQFSKLRELFLTRNNIKNLPKIQSLVNLRFLFLQENPIINLEVLQAQAKDTAVVDEKKGKKQAKKQVKKDKQKQSKGKQNQKQGDQDQPVAKQKKLKLYKDLQRFWISLDFPTKQQFTEAKQKIEKHMELGQPIVWEYDSFFGKMQKNLKRKVKQQFKELITKRIYLLNVFQNQAEIKDHFHMDLDKQNELDEQSNLMILQHQWTNIDIDEFIEYDWNEIKSFDLRGSCFDDTKWETLVKNANLFPQLRQIHLWGNKITTVKKGDLQRFKKLKKIDFYQVGWANPLSKESLQYLRKFKKQHPQIQISFEQEQKELQ